MTVQSYLWFRKSCIIYIEIKKFRIYRSGFYCVVNFYKFNLANYEQARASPSRRTFVKM